MGGKEKANVRFEIVIVNKTGKMFDPSMVSISMQSGNSEAEQIYDSAGGLSGSPSTPLLDGREAKFSVGFNVALATDLVMSVHTDFEHEATIFTS